MPDDIQPLLVVPARRIYKLVLALMLITSAAFASLSGTLNANALVADSPEDLKKAHELIADGDEESIEEMVTEQEIGLSAKQCPIQIDDMDEWERWVRFHLQGNAGSRLFTDLDNVTVTKSK